ncbi:hypothetical protein CS0771_58110 [Catellatospora sp. IY07-71]|uniref:hypothetical protein n=1 Tax=Catellatospora sp. IY07-71 TaxID=2728827 RepID=UPI001BB2FEE8|nr:hypothetical protein [Catellatospora sp. IY07-71]BCJ76267.1 hypothetical protein CS0771_58110 [Catellatospora sp. IY07-71]
MTGFLIAVIVLLACALGLALARRGRAGSPDLVQSALAARAAAPARTIVPADSDALSQQVWLLMSQGRKIHAVKLWREATGVPLADAVRAVERIAAGGAPPRQLAPADPQLAALLGPQVLADAQQLKRQGRAIQAIKLVREQTGVTLREAKDFVDHLR